MSALDQAMMTSWRQSRYGSPQVVTAQQVPMPTPGKGEVLIRVRAASINSGDVHIMRGEPLLLRLFFGLRRPRIAGRGMDAAGTVVALGAGVIDFTVGDEVVGELPGGALSEYATTPVARITRRPEGLSTVDAAALPLAGGTAWQALASARLSEGARVLVLGASGGVGTYVVQLAARRGAEVWATCSARNAALIGELGAARTLDLRTAETTQLPEDFFDAVFDISGQTPLRTLRGLLRPGGTVVLIGGEGSRLLGPIGRIARGALLSRRSRRIRPLTAVAKSEVTRELVTLAAQGSIRPVIERVYPLSEAGDALAHVDAGHAVGKVVVLADAESA